MALRDLLALVDDKLKDVFHTVAYDPARDRDKLVKRIDDTKAKFAAVEPARGKKDFTTANGVVAYSPTVAGNPLVIEGRETNYVPAERFADFLDIFRAEVAEGRLDKEITGAAKSDGSTTATKTPRKARAASAASGDGSGWSPERRAKFAETVAARKAAKGE